MFPNSATVQVTVDCLAANHMPVVTFHIDGRAYPLTPKQYLIKNVRRSRLYLAMGRFYAMTPSDT